VRLRVHAVELEQEIDTLVARHRRVVMDNDFIGGVDVDIGSVDALAVDAGAIGLAVRVGEELGHLGRQFDGPAGEGGGRLHLDRGGAVADVGRRVRVAVGAEAQAAGVGVGGLVGLAFAGDCQLVAGQDVGSLADGGDGLVVDVRSGRGAGDADTAACGGPGGD